MGQTEVIDQIWPVIDEANRTAEAYARISREMIHILPHNCSFPRTDKGSVIRQAFYKQFADKIDATYDDAFVPNGELKSLTLPELEFFVRETLIKFVPQAESIDGRTDLFSLGLDSLQAIQMRTEILKNVDIGKKKLGQNVIFEHPSIVSLSAHLHGLRTGQQEQHASVTNQMRQLIDQYGEFKPARRRDVALTGATGSLGAHVLVQLISRPDIKTVHCLVRAKDTTDATRRVRKSLLHRKLYHTLSASERKKIRALHADLSDPFLGLDGEIHESVARNLTSVIHCAWSVNFNKSLSSFETDCIAGVRNLLNLCLAVPSSETASFDFCSSVSTVARCPSMHTPETVAELEWAQNMGYAQSKCVAEHLCIAAAERTGVKARVLRVGQIVADTVHGVWNNTEAIPLMLQSAITVGALPKLQDSPSWTPVDVIAKAVTEISLSDAGSIVANVTNAKTFSWTEQLLPALRDAGLSFEAVEPKEWVKRLRNSNDDPVANPPTKLIDFFASKYEKDTFAPSRTYETSVARSFAPSLDRAPVLDTMFVQSFVKHFQAGSWKRAENKASVSRKKQIVILAGPCGSGKSTIASKLSSMFKMPFIEGDELHSSEAVTRMANGSPLDDATRRCWLSRIKQRASATIFDLEYDKVFVSCSALKKVYRDVLRELKSEGSVQVVFVDLQVGREELDRRMRLRGAHYMKEDMIESQLEIREAAGVMEADIIPIDAEQGVDSIVSEVAWLLDDFE
jgi:carbohydrate kinase (thermoresistant glucokinase family)